MTPQRESFERERAQARPEPQATPPWGFDEAEARQTCRAIREGEVDAFVVRGALGERVYTLSSATEAYRHILDVIEEGVVTLDREGTVVFAGGRLAEMLEMPLDDLVGHHFADFVTAEGRKTFGELLEGGAAGAECALLTRHHEIRPVLLDATPFESDAKTFVCVVVKEGVEKRPGTQPRASEERFRLAAQASRDVIWEWDLRSDGAVWIDPSRDPLGNDADARSAAAWRRRIHPEDLERVIAELRELVDGRAERWESELRLRRRDGTYAQVRNRALLDRDAEGRPRRLIGALSDVTQERQALADLGFLVDLGAALMGAHGRDEVAQTVQSRLWHFLSLEGCVLRISEPRDEHGPLEALPLEQRLEQLGREALAAGQPFVLEDAARTPGAAALGGVVGSAVCIPCLESASWRGTLVLWRAHPGAWQPRELALLRSAADRAWVALANAALNDELRRRSQQKDDFLATLSHELRNPLNPLKVAAMLLESAKEHLPEVRDIIVRQVDQLGRLLDDLLDVARITRGRIELRLASVSLQDVVAQSLESIRPVVEQKRQVLELALPRQPIHVRADPVRLVQILTNLVDNASKYSGSGARIHVEARSEGGQAVLSVRDTGRGIDPGILPHIFDLFVREDRAEDPTGLGIGLHVVKQLVDLHGGSVHCTSLGVDRGSEFAVRLPLLEPGDEGATAPDRAPVRSGRSCRVLVVDDHRDSATSLALWLKRRGCEVRIAHEGRTALQAAAEFRPEVVMLDLGLPDMDGYEVARTLRASSASAGALLVAVTGYIDDLTQRRAVEAGFDRRLAKPVDLAECAKLLAEFRQARPDDHA